MQVAEVPYNLFLIFTIAVVICVVIQAGVFLGLYFVARTAAAKAEKIATDVTSKALPIIVQSRTILEDLSPKIRVITANLAEISTTLKSQTQHVNSTVGDVVDKTRTQAERVDEMVTAVLDGVTHAGATIQSGVSKPVRRLSGILEGFRVAVETYFRSDTKARTGSNPTSATGSTSETSATASSRNYASAAGYQPSVRTAPQSGPGHVAAESFVTESSAGNPIASSSAAARSRPVPPPDAEPL